MSTLENIASCEEQTLGETSLEKVEVQPLSPALERALDRVQDQLEWANLMVQELDVEMRKLQELLQE